MKTVKEQDGIQDKENIKPTEDNNSLEKTMGKPHLTTTNKTIKANDRKPTVINIDDESEDEEDPIKRWIKNYEKSHPLMYIKRQKTLKGITGHWYSYSKVPRIRFEWPNQTQVLNAYQATKYPEHLFRYLIGLSPKAFDTLIDRAPCLWKAAKRFAYS